MLQVYNIYRDPLRSAYVKFTAKNCYKTYTSGNVYKKISDEFNIRPHLHMSRAANPTFEKTGSALEKNTNQTSKKNPDFGSDKNTRSATLHMSTNIKSVTLCLIYKGLRAGLHLKAS